MTISIRDTAFDPWQALADHTRAHADLRRSHGACAAFVGNMRDFNEGDTVTAMDLEHYPGMTERRLEQIVEQCSTGHEVLNALVIHRVGRILPGEDIVLVAVWTPHRKSAFTVCRDIMEALKSTAPFWKKETLVSGERWVARNTEG